MNSLSEQERIGLDEVFLSITSHSKLSILSRIRKSMYSTLSKVRDKTLFSLKYRVKMPKTGHFSYKNHKKKKFLS